MCDEWWGSEVRGRHRKVGNYGNETGTLMDLFWDPRWTPLRYTISLNCFQFYIKNREHKSENGIRPMNQQQHQLTSTWSRSECGLNASAFSRLSGGSDRAAGGAQHSERSNYFGTLHQLSFEHQSMSVVVPICIHNEPQQPPPAQSPFSFCEIN